MSWYPPEETKAMANGAQTPLEFDPTPIPEADVDLSGVERLSRLVVDVGAVVVLIKGEITNGPEAV